MIKEVDLKELNSFNMNQINSPFRRYITYIDNNMLLGYVSYDLIYDKMEIINVFVKEDSRGRKIGTNMLKYLIDFAKERHLVNITLEVNNTNIFAIKLYKKCGFHQIATRSGYYNGSDGLLMELKL